MRIIFLSTMKGWRWGGSEELWSQAASRLQSAGNDVLVAVPDWPERAPQVAALTRLGIPIYASSFGKHRGLLRRAWRRAMHDPSKTPLWFKQFQPDLVVISQGHNSGGFNWARICKASRVPYAIIVQCNSEEWWFGETLPEALQAYRSASRVFCVSEANLQLLRLQLGDPLPNAEVVRNPFNVSTEVAPPWSSSADRWKIASVARLDPAAKGHDILLQTLALPQWKERPVEVNLYGSGPDEPVLRRLTQMFGLTDVHFRGHCSDVRSIWAGNHLLALPSRYEGLPLALVEAMWCARPAVVTDVGGNSELCVENITGFVAPAPTVNAFSQALERAWQSRERWQQMGIAARGMVEARIPRDPIQAFCDRLRNTVP